MDATDLLTAVARLDPDRLLAEILELERRRDALRVLLRAARVIERRRARPDQADYREVPSASR
jgi:hypothetical protein